MTAKAGELAGRVDLWNNWVLGLGLATAVLGIAAFFAQRKVSKISKDLSGTQEQITSIKEEDARVKIANANKLAEEARLRSIELEAQIQPRYLSPAKRIEISSNLPGIDGINLLIASLRYDAESALLARQIQSAVAPPRTKLGPDSVDWIGAYPGIQTGALFGGGVEHTPEIRIGIEVWSSDLQLASTVVGQLSILGQVSISPMSAYPFGGIPGRFLAIFVGSKPVPDLPKTTPQTKSNRYKIAFLYLTLCLTANILSV